MRSLAYALLHHDGENPARADHDADRPWRANRELAARFAEDWTAGKEDDKATRELLATYRDGSADQACAQVADMLARGVAPQSIWDATFVGSGELLVRQPGIVALHAMTSTNALRYAFETTADETVRRRLLLQNVAFLPLFREAMRSRGDVKSLSIEDLRAETVSGDGALAVAEIFDIAGNDRMAAARRIMGYSQSHTEPTDFLERARLLIFLKGNNSHDYKFSSAVLEDYQHVSPAWRPRYLATTIFNLRTSADKDNALVERARAALA